VIAHASIKGPIAAALLAWLVGSGCAQQPQPVPRRESGLIVGTQGAGSEVVFPGVEIAGLVGGQGPGVEYARRDASMNILEPTSAFDADSWPAAPQPLLDNARFLYLSRNPSNYLYFNSYYGGGSYYGSSYYGRGYYSPRRFYWYGY
jgi:hypothetical protein